jgi:hypothetical protein
VGEDKKPEPPEVNTKPVTFTVPPASPVKAVAAAFSPPENTTLGTLVYPLPELVISIPVTAYPEKDSIMFWSPLIISKITAS